MAASSKLLSCLIQRMSSSSASLLMSRSSLLSASKLLPGVRCVLLAVFELDNEASAAASCRLPDCTAVYHLPACFCVFACSGNLQHRSNIMPLKTEGRSMLVKPGLQALFSIMSYEPTTALQNSILRECSSQELGRMQVLKAAGLRCVIDTDVFKTAAQHLSDRFHFASGQAAAELEVFAVAEDLMRWLKSNIFDLSISGPFYRIVQNISFVPATQVCTPQSFKSASWLADLRPPMRCTCKCSHLQRCPILCAPYLPVLYCA